MGDPRVTCPYCDSEVTLRGGESVTKVACPYCYRLYDPRDDQTEPDVSYVCGASFMDGGSELHMGLCDVPDRCGINEGSGNEYAVLSLDPGMLVVPEDRVNVRIEWMESGMIGYDIDSTRGYE